MGGELPSCQKGAKEYWKILSVCFLYFLTGGFVSILFLLMEEQTHVLKTVFSELWRWISKLLWLTAKRIATPPIRAAGCPKGSGSDSLGWCFPMQILSCSVGSTV